MRYGLFGPDRITQMKSRSICKLIGKRTTLDWPVDVPLWSIIHLIRQKKDGKETEQEKENDDTNKLLKWN